MRTFCATNCFIGHFGDDEDDLNEALLQASAEFESKITPSCNSSILGFGSISGARLRPQHTLPTATKPTSS